jgi:hypothetical protein
MADDLFLFQADTFEEKEGWIGAIGKAMIKGSKSNLYISEDDNM